MPPADSVHPDSVPPDTVHRGPDDPYLIPGPDPGEACLLVHGSTGTAGDMRFLGEFLSRQGYTVQGLSLPGHERRPSVLAGVRWQDCYAMVREAWLQLNARYRRVHVIGFSFGGSLALHLAANEKVEDLVLLAPALFVYVRPRDVLLSTFFGLMPGAEAHALLRWNLDLIRFFRQVKRDVQQVRCPFLLIHARDDATVRVKSSLAIYDRALTPDRRLRILDRGGHLLPHGIAREEVWEEIERHLASHRWAPDEKAAENG